MPKHEKQILAEALKLPPVERAELVENLLTSFEFQSRKKIDALWAEELMPSSVVKWRQSRQEIYLQRSKRIDVNENRIPSSRKSRV
jgi:hypothetical protein